MQTRRRLHSHSQDSEYQQNAGGEVYPLIPTDQHQQQQQQQQQQQHLLQHQYTQQQNPLFTGTGRTASVLPASPATTGQYSGARSESTVHIGAGTENVVDLDDKYHKKPATGGLQWNLRSLSTRIQASSSQALRNYIQQPLTAAAAVVTGSNTTPAASFLTNPRAYESSPYEPVRTQLDVDDDDPYDLEPDKEDIVIMASRDRTGEFTSAIRSLQSRNITRAVNIRDPRKAKQVQSYAEFMMVAKFIGKNIASTYAKLEKLTLFAKKKSLFDDRPQEIQELTYIIKGDLNALNQQIARLQEISKNQRRSTSGKHLVSHSSNMVLALQSKLASMSTDFKQILEVRTENLKQQKTRRDQFSQRPIGVSAVSPSAAKQGSLLLSEENQRQQQQHQQKQQAISIDMSSSGDNSDTVPLLGPPARLQAQQQMALYDDTDMYVQQRAETMQNIESTIVELGGIFQQLAHMVKEQEEIVERIDTNIQDAEMNIEAAHGEILKYFQSVSKNRWLMIKIFGVLIFFFIFFVVFLT